MRKKKTGRIIGTVLFLVCGLLLFGQISEVLRRKSGAESDMVHSFYEIEENTLDVVLLGTSHLYYGVQPNALWRDYGITSYSMGSSEQTIASSYFLLKEAFAHQNPKVVVLESYYFWYNGLYKDEARLRQAFDGMRFGKVKLEMIDEMLSDLGWKERLSYCLPFLKYHSRWESLEAYDFRTSPFLKGARVDFTTAEVENPGLPEQASQIPEINLEYLDKIQKLCEQNGAQLIVLAVPYGIEKDEEEYQERYQKRQGMNLALEAELEQRGIPFLFIQKEEPELIDFSQDFRDRTHLNTQGAEKLSQFLGAQLTEQFGLEDHRTDSSYEKWNLDLNTYEAYCAELRENPVDTADDTE